MTKTFTKNYLLLIFILVMHCHSSFAQTTFAPENNTLRIPDGFSYATIGDLDIAGTSITVEGYFSRDVDLTPQGYSSLNIVSKHWTPADVNYLLRVDKAQVTTTNGHHMTPDACPMENKKLYHVAMTYNGSVLKFFRNGILQSQIACSGNLHQNNYPTTIGATANSPTTNTTLIGNINEVRIWNVVKTDSEILALSNSSISNPTNTPGLLAYYTFDNLQNKQGNSNYNVTLHGSASINETIQNFRPKDNACTFPLPLKITDFSYNTIEKNKTLFKWNVEDELPHTTYTLEAATSLSSAFREVYKTVSFSGGKTNYTHLFSAINNEPAQFFRLKITELSGITLYSKILRITAAVNDKFSIFPNPAGSTIQLVSNHSNFPYSLVITDLSGRIVKQLGNLNTDRLTLSIAELPTGHYFVAKHDKTGVSRLRFQKQ
jgi:hypothetical protein